MEQAAIRKPRLRVWHELYGDAQPAEDGDGILLFPRREKIVQSTKELAFYLTLAVGLVLVVGAVLLGRAPDGGLIGLYGTILGAAGMAAGFGAANHRLLKRDYIQAQNPQGRAPSPSGEASR